jgi:hypothetical protein
MLIAVGVAHAQSPRGGSWSNGLRNYQLACPRGFYIGTIEVNSDSALTGFGGFTCRSGTGAVQRGQGGRVGGLGSKSTTLNSAEGNSGLNLRAGQLIDAIQFISPSHKVSTWQGGAGGEAQSVLCPVASGLAHDAPTTMKVVAIYGQATASHVITVGLHCDMFPLAFF